MLFTLVTLVLPTIYSQSTLPQTLIKQECKEEEGRFECQNGKCIPDYWLCDGVFDCPDKDDEEHDKCRPQMRGAPPETFKRGECPSRQFQCLDDFGNIKCALQEWLCDHQRDCADGSDELYCDYETSTMDSAELFQEKSNETLQSLKLEPSEIVPVNGGRKASIVAGNTQPILPITTKNVENIFGNGFTANFHGVNTDTVTSAEAVRPSDEFSTVTEKKTGDINNNYERKIKDTTGTLSVNQPEGTSDSPSLIPVNSFNGNFAVTDNKIIAVTSTNIYRLMPNRIEGRVPPVLDINNVIKGVFSTSQTVKAIANKPIPFTYFTHKAERFTSGVTRSNLESTTRYPV